MELENRLKQIKRENFIFIIYIGIIILSFYANKLEKEYLIFKNEQAKQKYRNILITIFTVAVLVYIYYAYDSYQSIKEPSKNQEIQNFNNLSFLASSLVLISGLIFLYIAYNDKDINVELAFS